MALALVEDFELSTRLEELAAEALNLVREAKADATLRAYRSDWGDFVAWCDRNGMIPLPGSPEAVVLYVTDLSSRAKAGTIQRRLTAITQAHAAAGYDSPAKAEAVRLTMAGIRRRLGTAQQGKAPALTADVRRMVDALPDNLLGTRDRALLLIGFAGAFRRSELVALDVADVAETDGGLIVTLRRSKTDQEGQGRKVGIPYGSNPSTCPVRALRAWLAASGIEAGPLFRPVGRAGVVGDERLSDKAVARVVKRQAAKVGLDPRQFSGHSLRAGLATSAAKAGVPERVIANTTGHRSMAVLRRYIRDGSLFTENAAAAVGL